MAFWFMPCTEIIKQQKYENNTVFENWAWTATAVSAFQHAQELQSAEGTCSQYTCLSKRASSHWSPTATACVVH